VARIASLENTAGSARLGVMIRESLSANARFVSMLFRPPTTTAQMQSRSTVGGSAATIDGATLSPPYWVRLTRAGNVFTGTTSPDGVTWTNVGQATIAMSSTTFVGLAATANSPTLLNTATATNVTVLADPVVAITSANRVYNNTPYAATASIAGNNSPLPSLSYVYYSDTGGTNVIPAPENVGTYHVRAFSAANAGNTVAQSAVSPFQSTPFALTVSTVGQNKTYDAITNANVTLADNRFSGDLFTITATASCNNKNIGLAKPISVTGIALSGSDAGNYTFNATASTTADISSKVLTASGTAANKTYDGNSSAVASISLIGTIVGDSVVGSASGTFESKNVATNQTVSLGPVTISGADAGNYNIGAAGTTTANITPKAIVGSITAANKVFDGSTVAAIASRVLTGALLSDTVNYVGGTATFDTAAVGTNKEVIATGLTLSGADAGNYTVNSMATSTADVLPVATISNRRVFYNNATGANLSSAGATDNAIASDKNALLPGEQSTYANYTNYLLGLNGLIVDVSSLPITTTDAEMLASFQFARWNGIDATGFDLLLGDAVPAATILPGSGVGGSARVKTTFPDNTLQNTWLRVTVVANSQTALAANDVFYFGNVIGEVNFGNTANRLRVSGQDIQQILSNQSPAANSASVTDARIRSYRGAVLSNAPGTDVALRAASCIGRMNRLGVSVTIRMFLKRIAFSIAFGLSPNE